MFYSRTSIQIIVHKKEKKNIVQTVCLGVKWLGKKCLHSQSDLCHLRQQSMKKKMRFICFKCAIEWKVMRHTRENVFIESDRFWAIFFLFRKSLDMNEFKNIFFWVELDWNWWQNDSWIHLLWYKIPLLHIYYGMMEKAYTQKKVKLVRFAQLFYVSMHFNFIVWSCFQRMYEWDKVWRLMVDE